MSPQKYEQDLISVNKNISYYQNEIEYHKKFSLIVPAFGILLAISGLAMTATLYNAVLTRGSDIQDKIKSKNLEVNEIVKKREKLLEKNYFYTKDFYDGENYKEFKEKVKEQKKKFEKGNKFPFIDNGFYFYDKSAKERFLNRNSKIEVNSPFIKEDYDKNEAKIKELKSQKVKILEEYTNNKISADHYLDESAENRDEIYSLESIQPLFENLQYKIQQEKLEINKEKDVAIVAVSLQKISTHYYKIKNYLLAERMQRKINSENDDRLEFLLLEEQKSKKEKETEHLERILAEKGKEQIQPSEIILISSQLLYRLGFLLVIELIAFYLITHLTQNN